MTTVEQNQEMIGRNALKVLVIGDKEDALLNIPSRLVIGDSCGCENHNTFTTEELRIEYTTTMGTMKLAIDTVKNMSLELAGVDNLEELYERLKKYVISTDMKAFYLCLDRSEDRLEIPMAYEGESFGCYGSYEKGKVLPDQVWKTEKASFYIVTSLFYSDVISELQMDLQNKSICLAKCNGEKSYGYKKKCRYNSKTIFSGGRGCCMG